ncbi:hypothetical protein GQ54DRAFT_246914, partial [Martensiomyces pterosporus]
SPGPELIDDVTPTVEALECTISEADRKQCMNMIQPALDENARISPLEPCPMEMAVVRLDTPPGRFTHQRQFPIAESYKEAMSGVINEWLHDGVIARMETPTPFNTPIFPIPKKDPTGAKTLCRPCMDFRALNDLL